MQQQQEVEGEIQIEHPGYLGARDTFYIGNCRGAGRMTFIDAYRRVVIVRLYDRLNVVVAADILNDRVVPFFDAQGIPLLRILTDRGTEYCGNREQHEYQLHLALENIDHWTTRVKSLQSNGIVERFQKTMLNEFYQVAFRKKIYRNLDELQADAASVTVRLLLLLANVLFGQPLFGVGTHHFYPFDNSPRTIRHPISLATFDLSLTGSGPIV